MLKRSPKTLKERLFVKEYIRTQNATTAALAAYDTSDPKVAKVIGSQNLTKLNFPDLIDSFGVTDEFLVSLLKQSLEATKIVRAKIVPDDTNSEPAFDYIRTEDWPTRLKALLIALKLKDKLTPVQDEAEPIPIMGGLSIVTYRESENNKKEITNVDKLISDD